MDIGEEVAFFFNFALLINGQSFGEGTVGCFSAQSFMSYLIEFAADLK